MEDLNLRPFNDLMTALNERVTNGLGQAVDSFNKNFAEWSRHTGATAQFGWKYDENGQKRMCITEINLPIIKPDLEDATRRAEEALSKAASFEIKPS